VNWDHLGGNTLANTQRLVEEVMVHEVSITNSSGLDSSPCNSSNELSSENTRELGAKSVVHFLFLLMRPSTQVESFEVRSTLCVPPARYITYSEDLPAIYD
jgi:hypothetical protein